MTTTPPPDLHNYRPMRPDQPGRRPPPPGRQPSRRKRRRRPPPQKRRGSALGSIVFWFAAIFVLLAGATTAAVFVLSPADLVRTELIRQVKANTGRTLTIAGRPSLTFYPSIGVSLPNVTLSPPPGMSGDAMIRSDRVHVSVALMPLLSRRAIVEKVTLIKPVIDLRVDRNGRRNWDFAWNTRPTRVAGLPSSLATTLSDAALPAAITKTSARPAQNGEGLAMLDNLELRSIRVSNGIVQYQDARSGTAEVVSNVDVRIKGRRIADPITMDGNLSWNQKRIDIHLRLKTLRKLLHGEAANASLKIKSAPLDAEFNGAVDLQPALNVRGPVKMDAKSLKNLARWLGTNMPNAKPLGGLTVRGNLSATPTTVTLGGAKLALGKTTATGSIGARLSDPRPKISANLGISQLDIDKLSRLLSGIKPYPRRKPKIHARSDNDAKPKSIEEILRGTKIDNGGAGRFSTQVRGYKKSAGWSRQKFDTSAMLAVDADARVKIDGLRVGGMSIGQTSARATLTNGAARVDIKKIALYGGNGRGVITAKRERKGISVGANLSLSGVTARPLLKDAAEIDNLDGNGQLTARIAGLGHSQQKLMSSLAGTAKVVFTDGAIIGWNIPQMMRGLQRGRLSDFQKEGTSKTDFSELSANFQISRGVANTQDLRMSSPLLRMTGSGNTDLGRRNIDMILRPKLVASLEGQEKSKKKRELRGFEVPVRVTGPWDRPKIKPDVAGLLNNRETVNQVVDNAKKLSERFKGKKANEIVKDLIGDQNKSGTGALLNKLFKKN